MLVLVGADAARAQTGPEILSLTDFQQLIAEDIAFLENPENRALWPQKIEELESYLTEQASVRLENGDIVYLDTSFLDPDDPETTLARLRLLQSELDRAANDNTRERMARLQQTLDELDLQEKHAFKFDLFEKLKSDPNTLSSNSEVPAEIIKWGIIVVGAGLLIYILGVWLTSLLGAFVEDVQLQERGDEDAIPFTAHQAREIATHMAQAGNYREAVRHLYLSILLKLEENGVIPRDRSKTNRELLTAIVGHDEIRQPLQSVIDIFEQVWYGVTEPDETTFHNYQRQIDELTRLLSHRQSRSSSSEPLSP